METEITIEQLKECLLSRAIIQENRAFGQRNVCLQQNKNLRENRLFNLYVGQLWGMIYMLEEIGMKEEMKQFEWVYEYGI